jgi:hypothetical protein
MLVLVFLTSRARLFYWTWQPARNTFVSSYVRPRWANPNLATAPVTAEFYSGPDVGAYSILFDSHTQWPVVDIKVQ